LSADDVGCLADWAARFCFGGVAETGDGFFKADLSAGGGVSSSSLSSSSLSSLAIGLV